MACLCLSRTWWRWVGRQDFKGADHTIQPRTARLGRVCGTQELRRRLEAGLATARQTAPIDLASLHLSEMLSPPPHGHRSAMECGVLSWVWDALACFRRPANLGDCLPNNLAFAVICARQLLGNNTVLPHYESQTVHLTKSCSLKA